MTQLDQLKQETTLALLGLLIVACNQLVRLLRSSDPLSKFFPLKGRGVPVTEACELSLQAVLTVGEVVKSWKKTKKTVMMQIYRGRIIARQTGERQTWIIARASVIALWGNPIED